MDNEFIDKIISISYLISLDTPVYVDMYDGIVAHACPYCNYTSDYEGSSLIPILEIDLDKNTFFCRKCGVHRGARQLIDFMNEYNDYDMWEKLKEALTSNKE